MSDGARFVRPSLDQIPRGDPLPPLAAGVASLGLNEGPSGPFPSALRAIAAAVPSLNRYPTRGSYELVAALAAQHAISDEQILVAAGADAVIGYVSQAVLDPGDEVVVPWPSFPSFVRDPQKRDAVVVTVPLTDGCVDLDALRAAITSRTKLLFLATPNNPTGRVVPRHELLSFVAELPANVLPVIDEAYFEYLEPPGRLDAIDDLVRGGSDVVVLRTFSKLYGLAGLRIGYGVGPTAVVAAMRKVQRGYDVGSLAQVAALASLADTEEVERRRAQNRNAVGVLTGILRARGLEPLSPSATNFVLVDLGRDPREVVGALLEAGVAVQSGVPFGAPTSIRIGAGSAAELDLLDRALEIAGVGVRGFRSG